MSKATYFIDTRVTVWRRDTYRVNESQEQLIFNEFESPSFEEDNGFCGSEYLFETEEQCNTIPNKELYKEDTLIKSE